MALNGKWKITIATSLVAAVGFLGFKAQIAHYAQAGDTAARAEENEKSLVPIRELVEQLGKRVAAEDAKLERDAELCLSCVVTDPGICGPAGVKVCEALE